MKFNIKKVSELMSMCNTPEKKLTKKEATEERLVGAVVIAVAKKSSKPMDNKKVNGSIHH